MSFLGFKTRREKEMEFALDLTKAIIPLVIKVAELKTEIVKEAIKADTLDKKEEAPSRLLI